MDKKFCNRFFLYGMLFCTVESIESLDYKELASQVTPFKKLKYKHSTTTFVKDQYGTKYVVKQIRFDTSSTRLAKLVCEMVALDVGHSIGVPLNRAWIIPANTRFPGKSYHVPVSLHTFVPGIRFDTYKGKAYKGLCIAQKNLKGERSGLTTFVIFHMSRHKDLPAMVALDTFVNNAGRGGHNFFYNFKTDRFCGIDMASAFLQNLSALSCATICDLLNVTTSTLTKREWKGLHRYYKALKRLVKLYTPELLCAMFDEYAALTGVFDDNFYDKKVQKACSGFIRRRKAGIYESYPDAVELVRLLKQLLAKKR